MKVIVAGFSKTGTKTMCQALTLLGYSVCDVMENMYLLEREWKKIFEDGWTTEDFQRMYENFDAVTDLPSAYFWEEIHKAFPEAKIILTVREDEDEWFKSLVKTYQIYDSDPLARLISLFSSTFRRVEKNVTVPLSRVALGMEPGSVFRIKTKLNEQLCKLKYRAHNAYVLQNAPADKLLVFNVSQGWEPLCKFLGFPVPEQEFPRKNVGGEIFSEIMKTHPTIKRMEMEFMASSALLLVLCSVGGYFTYKNGFSSTIKAPFTYVSNLFTNTFMSFFNQLCN